ncbi:MAG TPA: Ig-like domain repeat protein, partial [Pseudolabrys sp.]
TGPNATVTVCGGTLTATAGSIVLSGGTINANQQCVVSVPVTGTTAGTKTNTTGAVTSTNGGTGNTATAQLIVSNPATHFSIAAPATATAGTAFNFTVTALDASNNVATGYTGTVHFTSSDGQALLPADSTLTNGVGTFSSTLKTAGAQTITAKDTVTSSITGTSNAINVSSTAATHFVVTAPSTATSGIAFTFTVTAQDQFNNTVTGYTGTVHFTKSDIAAGSAVPANSTLTNGAGTFSATLVTPGAQTITATDTVTSSITGTAAINVNTNAATHFTVSAPATATSGTAFNFTITALDASNNVATTYTGTVHFTSSDGQAILPANSTLTNGVGTFSSTLKTAGSQTITATDTVTASITGTSNAINVSSTAATHFTVTAPSTATSGTALNFTVTALDASNNTATAYTGTVHFTSSDGQAILPADSTLTNGVGTFSSTLKTTGSHTITAKDTVTASISGTSNAINVGGGAATHFTVAAPATATAATPFSFTVTALDASNNVATAYTGTVHFTSSDATATLPANSTLNSGVGSFSATLKTDGLQTITATDTVTASITGTLNTINVGHKASSTTLTSSQNPSSGGQPVTFTATVAGSPGTPTGTVTFADGATALATVTMAGGTASFTTSSLTIGVHTIVATYSGDAGFASSTASLQQAVNVPADSLKLRQMQIIGTQLAAQSSGQAISGAIDSAINDGFNDNPALTTPSESGLHITFTGEPVEKRVMTAAPQDDVRDFANNPFKRQTRVDDAFSALGYAPRYNKAPPPSPTTNEPRVWTGWVDVRGVFWERNSVGSDIKGNQINAIAGVTARITPSFLVGVLGGYEHLDATSQVLTGQLKGGGWTAGTYLGWKFVPHLRLDAGVAGTLLDYQGTAGTAAGTFSGNRWLASGGVTGTYDVARFVVEPSARIYALWEHDNAYTDSLGTLQTERNFSTGRASGGVRIATPIAWTSSVVVTPYAGLYGDYYFSKDDEGVVVVTPIPLVQGWSARVVSGLSVTLDGKAQISIGGELGGLGSDYTIWSVRSRASVPFN